ncbi:MAG: MarR family transcriptional regulator [Actinobacteria bacterium]|nr:MarR family transcriptional regulator [Actinomycetota bacterium]
MPKDHVDTILEQWTKERPDIDNAPLAVIARISRLSRLFEKKTGETFASFGLSRSGFAVLAALRRSGSPYRLSPTQLYSALLVSSGAMTNRIDRLEEQDLVIRVPDPNDRRGMLVGLTPKGRKLIDEAYEMHVSAEKELLQQLSSAQRDQLSDLLRVLAVNLEIEDAPEVKS